MASSSQQQQQDANRMDRGTFVSSESFESLTCGASTSLIERLRQATSADASVSDLKELGRSVQTAAMEKLGGNCGGGVEVAFGGAMGRSFFATADGSTITADVVLFYTLVSIWAAFRCVFPVSIQLPRKYQLLRMCTQLVEAAEGGVR